MSKNPPPLNPIVVHVDFLEPLDAEAYANRVGREAAFTAKRRLMPGEIADVRLADRCERSVESIPTILITRSDVPLNWPSCDCCHRTATGEQWDDLFTRIAGLAGREGVATRGGDELASLTRRELEVLCLVGQGKTVGECAQSMGVATSTVGNHKYRLMRKLHVSTSLQLLRIAVRNGLADIE